MAGRRLSDQQKRRIHRRQERRLDSGRPDAEEPAVGDEHCRGIVTAHLGGRVEVEMVPDGGTVLCYQRANLPGLAVGDEVVWSPLVSPDPEAAGVVVALGERRTVLQRRGPDGRQRTIAANVDRLLIVLAPEPATPLNLVDRYLVAASDAGIEPVLVLNKCDLLAAETPWHDALDDYARLGYRTCRISALALSGAPLLPHLAGCTAVLAGQSGVGKSSLVRQLLGREDIAVDALSQATGKGQHTTTTARRYAIPGGGHLIDSPGIREFGLDSVPPSAVPGGFPEIEEAAAACRFRDCRHRNEPGCGVLSAVAAGQVSQRRLDSYHRILDTLEDA